MAFTIDDVRESFTSDVGDTLTFVEEAARSLLVHPTFAAGHLPDDRGRSAFQRIGEKAHAVAGTSALVQAQSLHQTARLLESIAEEGQEALAALVRALARARAFGELCVEGVEAMRTMLDLELEYRGEEALGHAQAWNARVAEVREALVTSAPEGETPRPEPTDERFPDLADSAPVLSAPSPQEYDFETFGSEATSGGMPTHGDPRLVDVFLEEAREAAVELAQHLRTLSHSPSETVALAALQRIFLTLKSSAAMASLADVASLAEEGLLIVETMLAGQHGTLEQVNQLTRSAQRVLAAAGVAPAQLGAEARPAGPVSGSIRDFFREEVRQIVSEARALAARLASSERPRDRLAQLGQLFHRLKGSALIVGQHEVATEAARLQTICDDGTIAEATKSLPPGMTRVAEILRLEEPAEGLLDDGDSLRLKVPASTTREAVQVTAVGELWEAFLTEFHEILDTTERRVLELETAVEPKRVLEALFREYHTLKGAVNTVGLAPTGRMLHRIEDFVAELGDAPILPPMRAVATFFLDMQQHLRQNLATATEGWVELPLARIDARIAALKTGEGRGARKESEPLSEAGESSSSVAASSVGAEESSSSSVASSSSAPEVEGARERHMLRVPTERLDSLMNLGGELVLRRLQIANRLSLVRGVGAELTASWIRLASVIEDFRGRNEFTVAAARRVAPEAQIGPATWAHPFAELELDRYDDVNLLARQVTELSDDVTDLGGQLQREVDALGEDADSLSGIVSGMQRELTAARMVPLKPLFGRLRLPIRDAGERVGRELRVVIRGEDVTVDKEVVDALFAPLLHLVRNAVSHGIEPREVRLAAGKPPEGTIHLTGRQESARIVIEVKDDGAGLNLADLKRRGVEMGLLAPTTPLEHRSVKDLVFVRGLSTQAAAGDVAGRGVGCDVVREAVEQMGGAVRVETAAGQGTTFVITLPLTLAITRAVLVRAGERVYALPMVFVERILETDVVAVESAGLRRVEVGGELLVTRALSEILSVGPAQRGPIVVVRVGEHTSALEVDAVLGQEEIVVKNLGEILTGHPLFAGLTVRGSGDLVLILDVPGLLANTQAQRRSTGSSRELPVAGSRRAAPEVARIRALYVDDSLSVRKFAQRTLTDLGLEVTTAVDGLDALNRLRDGTFDIVFTDLEMPRMNGYDFLRELRYIPTLRELPVVVVSSRSLDKHREQARALGATEFLTKPFSSEALVGVLRKWVPRASGSRLVALEGPPQARPRE